MSPEEGTSVWPRSTKKSRNMLRSSLAFIAVEDSAYWQLFFTAPSARPAQLQFRPQLGLALAHGLAALLDGRAHVGTETPSALHHVVGHPLGRVALGRLAQELLEPVRHPGAQPDADAQPEETLEHRVLDLVSRSEAPQRP